MAANENKPDEPKGPLEPALTTIAAYNIELLTIDRETVAVFYGVNSAGEFLPVASLGLPARSVATFARAFAERANELATPAIVVPGGAASN
jgi:hypothetical protein